MRDKERIRLSLSRELSKTQTPWEGIPEDYRDYEGFVYLITNNLSGKKYVGRKYFWRRQKKRIVGESDWRVYKGSNANLLLDIKDVGIHNFSFEILSVQRTIAETNFQEVAEQFKRDVLRSTLPDGSAEYYNDNILSRYFRPKDFGTKEYEEKCKNISKALREGYESGRIKHPMEGKSHPNRGKKLPQTGHHSGKGMKSYTNGSETIRIHTHESIPDGFYPGVTRKARTVKVYDRVCSFCCKTDKVGFKQSLNKYCSKGCQSKAQSEFMKTNHPKRK